MMGELEAGEKLLDQVESLLLERVGFDVGSRLQSRLQSAVEAVARELKRTPGKLVRDLRRTDLDHPVWRALLARVMIGETYFFRDARQFAALQQVILPALLHEREKVRSLTVWSAGCASGEEPYSVAMMLRELLEKPERWKLTIVGTDVNDEALRRAREALYRRWSFRRTPHEFMARYFHNEHGLWRLHEDVRAMVSFRHLNLADPNLADVTGVLGTFDLVLCRNVLMYMPPRTRATVAQRLTSAVVPGGRLMVAAAELDRSLFPQLIQEREGGVTVYRRPLVGEEAPRPGRSHSAGTRRPVFQAESRSRRLPGRRRAAAKEISRAVSPSRRPKEAAAEKSESVLETADKLVLEARRAADLKRSDEAAVKAERALALDPLCAGAYHVLGLLALERGDLDGAMGALRRALYIDPRLAPAHLVLAAVAARKGQTDTAKRHRALAMDLLKGMPEDAEVPGEPGVTAKELLTSLGDADASGVARPRRIS